MNAEAVVLEVLLVTAGLLWTCWGAVRASDADTYRHFQRDRRLVANSVVVAFVLVGLIQASNNLHGFSWKLEGIFTAMGVMFGLFTYIMASVFRPYRFD